MKTQISWMSHVEAYLAHRRDLGLKLTNDETRLRSFARFADQVSTADHLMVALAIAWARASRRPRPLTWARRIKVLRGFARFCQRLDPPRDLFGSAHQCLVPHIYTAAELIALLKATDDLIPINGLRAATCRTVFGLLAASGLRIAEALALTRAGVDPASGVLCIEEAKFHQRCLMPLHPSVTEQLRAYARRRDQLVPRPACERFFLRDDGQSVSQRAMLYALLLTACTCRFPRFQHCNCAVSIRLSTGPLAWISPPGGCA